MPLPADFSDLFDGCKTHHQANEAYKEGVRILQEALRLTHVRIVTLRDAPTPTITKQSPQNDAQAALKAVQRSHDAAVRNWAARQGISFRRVNKKLREAYDEAHRDG